MRARSADMGGERNVPPSASTKVYVGQLHWWIKDEDVEQACASYGNVRDLTFYEDKSNGKFKGYVLVDFETPQAAAACQREMHGKQFDGKPCVVTYAQSEAHSKEGVDSGAGGSGGAVRKERERGQQRSKPYDRKQAIATAAFGSAPPASGNPRPPWETQGKGGDREGPRKPRDGGRRREDRRRR